MTNEQAKADLASIVDEVQQQMRTIARVQQARAELTGTGTARGKRVTVTVNADNAVIETKFSADIAELEYAEIAKAVTEASQRACAEVAARTGELMQPVREQQARLPKLADLIEDMPNMQVPESVAASTAPPRAPERRDAGTRVPGPVFAEPDRGERAGSVTDQSW
ncbi:YbaB/EbfC family nucleoid-associated protein [Nocardia asteroides]|uniref:YbaB/EbfC family nucleoid-associated protein n=1 Tax=Nocardia asteroides TaxID=1824 RepID=UPI001E5859C4|nr:YbaB/EbfC family nucleoid-associated protein [Nocardia asteroides]UGT59994.1 YbaB/EbfC family nucleoid-associated protein [Nocardia asteroides]